MGQIFIDISKENKAKIFDFQNLKKLSRNISWKNSIENTLAGARAFLKTGPQFRGFLFHLEDAITFQSSFKLTARATSIN